MISFLPTGQAYSSSSVVQNQNELFEKELARQTNDIGRIEKITVNVQGKIKNEMFSMNKHLSTPFNVAQRMQFLCIVENVI